MKITIIIIFFIQKHMYENCSFPYKFHSSWMKKVIVDQTYVYENTINGYTTAKPRLHITQIFQQCLEVHQVQIVKGKSIRSLNNNKYLTYRIIQQNVESNNVKSKDTRLLKCRARFQGSSTSLRDTKIMLYNKINYYMQCGTFLSNRIITVINP